MLKTLAKNQNWAKAAPFHAIASGEWIFVSFPISNPKFWTLINIPLYFLHQIEDICGMVVLSSI